MPPADIVPSILTREPTDSAIFTAIWSKSSASPER